VQISGLPVFVARASAAVEAACPGIRPVTYGHVGEGNLHFNFTQPVTADKQEFLARGPEINAIVYDITISLGGTISAEHGVGQLKRDAIARYKDPIEMALMRTLKQALNPNRNNEPRQGGVKPEQQPIPGLLLP